ncbi:MAG: class I SAM-dependent methyltransferase [Sandaracinaceae bacterium]|nr:class I SAM-dependent methyltransferase [Sandaracinaceae bacterium]
MLELGCGTGRINCPRAGGGDAVTGVDSMRSMLDVVEERPASCPACSGEP